MYNPFEINHFDKNVLIFFFVFRGIRLLLTSLMKHVLTFQTKEK